MGYFEFEKTKDFAICIDSDGCAMDTMEVKHRKCFGPQWIKTFGLEEHYDCCMDMWLSINLYTATRGINRFKGLALALQKVEQCGFAQVEGLEEYVKWTKDAKELSNPALLELTQKVDNPCIEKALLWSIRTNRAIHGLPPEDMPFPNVKWTMDAMTDQADLVAVSSANKEAVDAEWTKHHLKENCKELLTQEVGTKAFCIGKLKEKGYPADHILMVGDAPGDKEAAQKNGVFFYPILVGKEGESWGRLLDEAFPKFLAGEFDDQYQKQLIQSFDDNLGIKA